MRTSLGLLAVLLLAGAACSDDGDTSPDVVTMAATAGTLTSATGVTTAASTSSSDSPSPSSPTTIGPTVPTGSTASTIAPTGPTASAGPTTSTATTNSTVPPTVLSADGWTLVVERPRAGAAVSTQVTVCYTASGNAREPALDLAWRIAPAGGEPDGDPTLVPIGVGSGEAVLDLDGTAAGTYDLEVRLVVDGVTLGGEPIVIPGLVLTPGRRQTGPLGCA